jgi:hypothetical protein
VEVLDGGRAVEVRDAGRVWRDVEARDAGRVCREADVLDRSNCVVASMDWDNERVGLGGGSVLLIERLDRRELTSVKSLRRWGTWYGTLLRFEGGWMTRGSGDDGRGLGRGISGRGEEAVWSLADVRGW